MPRSVIRSVLLSGVLLLILAGRIGLPASVPSRLTTDDIQTAQHIVSVPNRSLPPVQQQDWVTTWGASPVAPVPNDPHDPSFSNQTVRLIVHASVGGDEVRVRFSNTFGINALVIGEAHIALHSTGADIVPGTDRALTFNGARSVTIPPGMLVVSDAAELSVPALSDLAVSIYFPDTTGPATWHPLALVTNYVALKDFADTVQLPVAQMYDSWFYLTDVEVGTPTPTPAIVALGDSITDGSHSTQGTNHRWPNLLAERLANAGVNLAVVDAGIADNAILHEIVGPSALSRFDRDVLNQSGVKYVIVLLGINDIGHSSVDVVTTADIIAGYQQMITWSHERGLKIFGATLTPFGGSPYDPPTTEDTSPNEIMREAINYFIRTSGTYDAVIDFDMALRDPTHPTRLLEAYDSGDHLHPNDAGYQAMADAVDLSLFQATGKP